MTLKMEVVKMSDVPLSLTSKGRQYQTVIEKAKVMQKGEAVKVWYNPHGKLNVLYQSLYSRLKSQGLMSTLKVIQRNKNLYIVKK